MSIALPTLAAGVESSRGQSERHAARDHDGRVPHRGGQGLDARSLRSGGDQRVRLGPHRFELAGAGVQRYALAPDSPEAASPLDAVQRAPTPTAWSHSTIVTLLADCDTGTVEFEQEMVEILAMEGETVLAEAAAVIRIPGLAPCLGPFHCP